MGGTRYSRAAVADMHQLAEEVELVSGNPQVAAEHVKALMEWVDGSSRDPRARTNLVFEGKPTGYSYIVHNGYVAFYRADGDAIPVDRVLPLRSNFLGVLGFGTAAD